MAPTKQAPPPVPSARKPAAQAAKPATTVAPPTSAKTANAVGATALIVSSKAGDKEVALKTLVGEYIEGGKNHGRSFYKKKADGNGSEEAAVFLYYWDLRDGPNFSGWWFGDKVGGAQVWSRCEKADPAPPAAGWRVPWDGKVNPNLAVEVKKGVEVPKEAKEEEQEAKEEPTDLGVPFTAELDERVQRATDRVVIAEIEATQALESTHAMMEGEVSDDALKVVEELLQAQQSAMMEAHKVLAADIIDARKSSPKSVAALNALTPRVRSVQASLAHEVKQAKALFAKKKQEAVEAKQKAKAEMLQAKAEQRDAKALEAALPEAMEIVTGAEDTLDAVVAAAGPLAAEFVDQQSEAIQTALTETEAAVTKAQEAIKAARNKINEKVTDAKQFAPEAKKVALTEYSTLQEKLNDAMKKLAPYARCRKDHQMKVEGKKVLAEIAQKLGVVEVEVEKVTSLLAGANPTEEEIKTAEAALPAVTSSLAGAMKVVDAKVSAATGTLKEDLVQMQTRGNESKKKLNAFKVSLRSQLEQLQVQIVLKQALEKTQACEEALGQTTVAEAPFLKGIDAFTGAEAAAAITASKEAATAVDTKSNAAKTFLKAKLLEVKRFPEATQESCTDELSQLQSRLDVVVQKLAAFKRDTSQREASILLAEVAEKVSDAEAKVQKTLEVSKPLEAENLEEVGLDKLKDATARTLEAEKAAAMACADAKKVLSAKQKDGQAQESATLTAELTKLETRLTSAQQELSKQRKVAVQGEKLWKSKLIIQDKEEHMKQVEAEVDRADLLTTPLGDEEMSRESIIEMDTAVTNVEKTVKEVVESLTTAQQSASGTLKSQLVKLLARTKKSQEKIDEMKARTREQRERVQCENIMTEARGKLEKVDVAFQQVAAAEVPFLKGIELLPVDDANKAVADSEAAAAAVQQAINETRSFLATKTLEVKKLLEAVAKTGLGQIETFVKKIDESREKLAQFNKETEGRKRIAQTQTAAAKVAEAEEAVQRTVIAAAPLAVEEETSQEAAQEIVERLGETEKEAQEKLDDARTFLQERQRDKKAKMDAAELSKLVTRLNSVQVDLAKAKAASSEHEQKFVAKMLLQEANEVAQGLESELDKVTEAAAPLVVEGGKSFVVASMTKMVTDALVEYCSKHNVAQDSLFATIAPGAAQGKVSEMEFVAYLEKLPELCSRTDLSFSSDQRSAIFGQLDADKDGFVGPADFKEMFRDQYICVQEVAITDEFDVAKAKTLDQINLDDVVEAIGETRSLETMGLMRVQVRVLKDGTTGWVTTHGNQGTLFFTPFTAYTSFVKNLDRTIQDTLKTAAKAVAFVASKAADLRECKQGPLAEAKLELSKIRPKVNIMRSKLDQLHKKVEEGKREHSKREEFERRKQEEKKHRQAAMLVVKAITERVDKAQTAMQQLEEAGSPLTSVNESDLGSVEKPLSARKAAQAASEAVTKLVQEAKEALAANDAKVAKATKGPWFEAKQDITKLKQQVNVMDKKAGKVIASVVDACDTLLEAKMGEVSTILRTSVQTRNITIEQLFTELAGKKGEHITEAAFGKHLDKTKELKLSAEQKQMIIQKLGAGGISRRSFMGMLQRYFKCVKEIAITSEFDIKVSTTLRKLEAGEFVEVMEGPKSDESLGVTRIRAKPLSDGQAGWITAKGNQGTPFLEECVKPCYFGTAAMPLQDNFASEGAKEVGTLKAGDVLEVIEGPRREVVGNAVRARGKAVSDGATGWFTVKTKQGTETVKSGKSSYTCTSGIALTSDVNIKDCKVLRKLDKGEVLMVIEGPIDDEAAGVTRIKAKASKDDMEGWVTTKGNAGSVYATESGRTYVVTSKTPLQNRFNSEHAKDVRVLAEEETVELLEGPKEEKTDAPMRVQGRSSTDGKIGWVTLRKGTMKLWSPNYKCLEPVAITSELDSKKGEVRSLEAGETFELLEGPKLESDTGALRMKGAAAKDSATGWVTISGSDGKSFMECVAAK